MDEFPEDFTLSNILETKNNYYDICQRRILAKERKNIVQLVTDGIEKEKTTYSCTFESDETEKIKIVYSCPP